MHSYNNGIIILQVNASLHIYLVITANMILNNNDIAILNSSFTDPIHVPCAKTFEFGLILTVYISYGDAFAESYDQDVPTSRVCIHNFQHVNTSLPIKLFYFTLFHALNIINNGLPQISIKNN